MIHSHRKSMPIQVSISIAIVSHGCLCPRPLVITRWNDLRLQREIQSFFLLVATFADGKSVRSEAPSDVESESEETDDPLRVVFYFYAFHRIQYILHVTFFKYCIFKKSNVLIAIQCNVASHEYNISFFIFIG